MLIAGSDIQGYLIPDGFGTKPRVSAVHGGQIYGPIPCDVFLEVPYNLKHHETGVVGFHLHEGNVPGLSRAADIEISDADSGFVFYRRLNPERHIQKRVFRLETQLAPHSEIDQSLKRYFQFYAPGVERLGSETVRQTLEIVNQPSTYVSGRVLLKSVQGYLTDETVRITSVRDPFYELALRLWAIATFKHRNFSFVSERDVILFKPAIAYFSEKDSTGLESLVADIKAAPKDVLFLFQSPFTHQLVAANPSDRVSREAVSAALDALSQFTVFTANESDHSFALDIGESLGIDGDAIAFVPMRSAFLELATELRKIGVLEHILESDLILFHFIKRAEHRVMNDLLQNAHS